MNDERKCRYAAAGCTDPITHFCDECGSGPSGFGGHYCEQHAKRHDDKIREILRADGIDESHAVLAKRLDRAHVPHVWAVAAIMVLSVVIWRMW
jgi:hypothetical protein